MTETETLRMRERLANNPNDHEAIEFFTVLDGYERQSRQ
jgi:hypothetical protein